MSSQVKKQVGDPQQEAEAVFKKIRKIKAEVASLNAAIGKDEALRADQDLVQEMIAICDELGIASEFESTRRWPDQNPACS